MSSLNLVRKVPDTRASTPVQDSDFVHADAGTLPSFLLNLVQDETKIISHVAYMCVHSAVIFLCSCRVVLHGLRW